METWIVKLKQPIDEIMCTRVGDYWELYCDTLDCGNISVEIDQRHIFIQVQNIVSISPNLNQIK